MNDKQNDEIAGLVKSIDNSDHDQHALQLIFQETDKAGEGKGDILRDQEKNGVSDGMAPPVGEGVLIFDEVKVCIIMLY